MKVEQLKRGLFGYRKQSVYRCIAEMEEGYSARLLEQEERGKQEAEQYRQKIRDLEEKNRELCQERDQYKNKQMMIADTLLEARRYAEEEREETKKQEQKLRRILELAEKKFETLEEQSSALLEAAPAGNMSLFTAKEDETE